ncbi:MAG: IS200/IS605 family transposase [Candidatus Hydrogenedentota bacterium]
MAQSLALNLIHLVYSTKLRKTWLKPDVRPSLFAYQAGVLRELESPALVIGGTDDHVHALFMLSKKRHLTGVIEEVKKSSSKWLKTQGPALADFQWQSGYGAFSVSQSKVAHLRQYIETQETHHRTATFKDEFRRLLEKHGIKYDERYVWD